MTAEAIVSQMIADAQGYAKSAFNDAQQYLNDAVSIANAGQSLANPPYNFTTDNIDDPVYPSAPAAFSDSYVPPVSDPARPTFEPWYIPQLPAFSAAPQPIDTSNLFKFTVPTYDVTPFDKTAPVARGDEYRADLDAIANPTLEDPGDVTITPVTLGNAPDITVPKFDKSFQGQDPGDLGRTLDAELKTEYTNALPVMQTFVDNAVDNWLSTYAPGYHTALAKLEAKIAAGIDGGTAIDDTIEQAIYDRGRDRIEQENDRLTREVLEGAKKRGFAIPPGSISGGLARAQAATAQAISRHATETAIERAKIELAYAQVMMELSLRMTDSARGTVLQYMGQLVQINGQALEYSQAIVRQVAEVYNLKLARHELLQKLYRVEAGVYEVESKSAFAELEEFKAQAEAERLRKDVELAQLDAVDKKIGFQRAKIEFFLAKIQKVAEKAKFENNEIALFGEHIKAYIAQVSAKESEYKVFEAAMRGDEKKVDAEVKAFDGYLAEVKAITAKAETEQQHSRAISDQNRALADLYKTDMDKYKTDAAVEGQRFDGAVKSKNIELDVYKTNIASQLETLKAKFDKARMDLQVVDSQYRGALELVVKDAQLFAERIRLQAQTATSAADISESIASAALSSNNSILELSNSTVTTT